MGADIFVHEIVVHGDINQGDKSLLECLSPR